jgi:hypothetical protein
MTTPLRLIDRSRLPATQIAEKFIADTGVPGLAAFRASPSCRRQL